MKQWNYIFKDEEAANGLTYKYKIPSIISKLLVNRGLLEDSEIRRFFNPSINDLHSPYLFEGMQEAVERIKKAVSNNEKITIYGDYDADGVTATTVMYLYLKETGANVNFYIPNRISEGYGINKDALSKIITQGTTLIITVDCGITAVDETEYLKSNGVDVIITDHHECPEILPEAIACINPKINGTKYPFAHLSGVGVAFKLVCAISGNEKLMAEKYLPFVAIGTVGDVMPLKDENRILVDYGIKHIKNNNYIGLSKLIEKSIANKSEISATDIAFIICPRINALGRMDNASYAVELFITQSEERADELTSLINRTNQLRQKTEQNITAEAVTYIENNIDVNSKKILVVAGDDWHPGVLGIAVAKITEKYNLPSVILSKNGGVATGSCRSIPGFNLFEAIKYCEDLLTKFGGHEAAAGITLSCENITQFDEKINEYAKERLVNPHKTINIESSITAFETTEGLCNLIKRFEPFGCGNEKPVFALENARVVFIKKIGNDKHLKLKIIKDDKKFDAVGFNMAQFADALKIGSSVSVAFEPSVNYFNGTRSLQLLIKDLQVIL